MSNNIEDLCDLFQLICDDQSQTGKGRLCRNFAMYVSGRINDAIESDWRSSVDIKFERPQPELEPLPPVRPEPLSEDDRSYF